MAELSEHRRFYAEELRWAANLKSERVVEAFATVPRERFLGAGPWKFLMRPPVEYRDTPDDDPRHLYHNVLVALVPEIGLNNGQPAFLALLIDAAAIAAGDRVVHIGCGVRTRSKSRECRSAPTRVSRSMRGRRTIGIQT